MPVRYSATGARLRAPAISALMSAALDDPRLLSLAAGFTDTSTLPVGLISRTVGALAIRDGQPEHLQYGSTQGRRRLRELLAARTARQDGVEPGVFTPGRTLIGNGSQQLLYLAVQALCDPGDIVLVERPTYFVFLDMLAGLGVRAVSLRAQMDGSLDPSAIAEQLESLRRSGEAERIKAVYTVAYFANPSGRTRGEEEKSALAAALERAGVVVPVLEDAAYRELWFEHPPAARSCFAPPAWKAFPKLYFGTLTKPFASGLKVGFAHASHEGLLDRMAWLKGHHDFGTSHFNQAILEQVLETDAYDAHLAGLRPAYGFKMRSLDGALEEAGLRRLGWRWDPPDGGLYLWLTAPEGLDTSAEGPLWKACLAEGVLYVPGGLCLADADDSRHVRLSFGVLGGGALAEAARRFQRAAARVAAEEPRRV